MFCTKCGTEVVDGAAFCSKCGARIDDSEQIETSEIPETTYQPPKKAKRKTKLLLLVSMMAVIVLLVCVAMKLARPNLSENEKRALENCEYLIDHLKNPDSFKLYDEIILLRAVDYETNEENEWMFIEYGATNGYGAMVRSTDAFDQQGYLGDINEDEDDFKEDNPDRYLDFLMMKLTLNVALMDQNYGIGYNPEKTSGTWYEFVTIPVDNIIQKLGIDK